MNRKNKLFNVVFGQCQRDLWLVIQALLTHNWAVLLSFCFGSRRVLPAACWGKKKHLPGGRTGLSEFSYFGGQGTEGEDGAVLTRRLERRRVVSLRQDVRGGEEGQHLAGAPSSFYQPLLLLLLHPGLFCRLHSNEGGGVV